MTHFLQLGGILAGVMDFFFHMFMGTISHWRGYGKTLDFLNGQCYFSDIELKSNNLFRKGRKTKWPCKSDYSRGAERDS